MTAAARPEATPASLPQASAAIFRRFLGGLLLSNLFVIVLAVVWLLHARQQDVDNARVDTQNLVRVLEQNLAGTARYVDLALLAIVDEFARRDLGAADLNRLLARHQAQLPELESLRIADAQGVVRYGAGVAPGGGVNVADRDYFVGARDHAAGGMVISKPLFARISKKWAIVFARRLHQPDGSFGGVVYVNLALERIAASFAALDVGPRGAVTLRDGELGIIVRHPEPRGFGSTIGSKVVSPEFRKLIEAGHSAGTFTVHAGIDNIERVFSFRRVGGTPLYLIVGRAKEDFLADWRGEALRVGVLVVLFVLGTLLAAWLLFGAWKRQLAAAEAVARLEDKFHTLADFTYDWEYWQSADRREVLYMTPSCERITGYTPDEFAADPGLLLRIVHPDDRAAMAAHLDKYAEPTEDAIDFRILRRDGAVRWIAHACRPVSRADGNFLGRRVGNRDVTERKQIEQALVEAEARFRSSFASAAIGMALVSLEGRFTEVNAALCAIVGYTPAELKRKSFQEITHPEDLAADLAYAEQLAAGSISSYRMEKRYLHKDGRAIWIMLTGSAVRDEQGRLLHFIAQIEDIGERRTVEESLRTSEARLRHAQRIAQIGSWELDLVDNKLSWSDEVFRIFELESDRFDASYEAFLAVVHPEDRERVNHAYTAAVKNHLPYEITHRLLLPDGNIKYVRENCETAYSDQGTPLRSVGTVQDVTLAVLNEQAMRESEERFRTIADYTYDWEYWQGPQGEFLYISPSCLRVTGYSQGEFISDPGLIERIVHPDDRHLMAVHGEDIRHKDTCTLDFRIVTKEAEIRWIAHGCRAVYAKDGRHLGRRASNRDITDRKAAEEQVQQLAYFDTLTSLPNRRMLMDRLNLAVAQAKRFRRAMAIMFLDLDHFKQINDTLGHDVGDALLKEVAARLTGCVRQGDTVSRQGGDEFVVVLAEIAAPDDAALVAQKIVAAVNEPVPVAGHVLHVTTSIGIAVYPVDGIDDIQDLLIKADKAMYAAKGAGRNRYRFFAEAA